MAVLPETKGAASGTQFPLRNVESNESATAQDEGLFPQVKSITNSHHASYPTSVPPTYG